MKEKILAVFKELGFKLELVGTSGFSFDYEGKHYLCILTDDDEYFLNIAIPGVLEIEGTDDIEFYKLMDLVNYNLRYIKVYLVDGCIWIFYERELFDNDDLKTIISHMIAHLDIACDFIEKAVKKTKSELGNGCETEDPDDAENDDETNDGGKSNE